MAKALLKEEINSIEWMSIVVPKLSEICCIRCILHSFDCNLDILAMNEKVLRNAVSEILVEFSKSKMKETQTTQFKWKEEEEVCVCCLGMLESIVGKEFGNEIEIVLKSKYSIPQNLKLLPTIPTSILERQFSLFVFLLNSIPNNQNLLNLTKGKKISIMSSDRSKTLSNYWFETKEIFRKIVRQHLRDKQCGIEIDATSELGLNITLFHNSSLESQKLLEFATAHFKPQQSQDRSQDPPPTKKQKLEEEMNEKKNQNKNNETKEEELVAKYLLTLSEVEFKKMFEWPPSKTNERLKMRVDNFQNPSIYIGGRYSKYCRETSQSIWLLDEGGKRGDSVEENIIEGLKSIVDSNEFKFITAGREDENVRMLGDGRPFLFQCSSPSSIPENFAISKVQSQINSLNPRIFISHLHLSNTAAAELLKEGEETKTKTYKCLVWSEKPISTEDMKLLNSTTNISVDQQTPIRVLHRRTIATRAKIIHWMKAKKINKHFFELELHTQAGTYVKEFVSGDMGRSSPSVSSLLNTRTDILQLDVLQISMSFP